MLIVQTHLINPIRASHGIYFDHCKTCVCNTQPNGIERQPRIDIA